MDFNKFMNMNVDLDKFTNYYNSIATSKVNFGGGKMKVKDLVKKNAGKLKVTKSKTKGGAVTDSDARDNLFYKPIPEPTNVNRIDDMTLKQISLPASTNTLRGLF
jgi:hypothetical protein